MKSASAHHTLKQLMSLAEAQQQLTQVVRSALPEALRGHLLGTALEREALVLLTDQAAWGSRLRYLEAELLEAVRQTWPHLPLKRIRVRVIQLPRPTSWHREAVLPPDAEVVDQMAGTAESLRHDNVRERLMRLSKKLKEKIR